MTGSLRDLVVLQLARLRLACEALGVEPDDVRLDDLTSDESERLVGLASLDFIAALGERRRARAAREPAPAADLDRAARFRELASLRRARLLRARVRASDVSGADVPHDVPRGPKRDRSDQGDQSEAPPCGVESRQDKIA